MVCLIDLILYAYSYFILIYLPFYLIDILSIFLSLYDEHF